MTRDIILYGDLPAPCYVLRLPARGVSWRALMQAARRLVKTLTNTPAHKAAPYWNIDGDAPPWDTTKQPRYVYDVATGEFLEVK